MWDKLDFIKSRDLIDQQQHILQQLEIYDSNNPLLQMHEKEFRKTRALSALLKQSRDTIDIDYATYADNKLSDKEVPVVQNIFNHLKNTFAEGNSCFYDFSILFYQIGAYEFSLKCLELTTPSSKTQWLKLELLHLNKRYFECINLCNQLFLHHSDNPDLQFASLYQKSQALWSIGSHDEAVEVMQSIVTIRPNYRSAYEFLQSWKEAH